MRSEVIVAACAVSGLVAGCSEEVKPRPDVAKSAEPTASAKKSCCAGKNDCKGKGGCKTAHNDCSGKNDCKGKGGCGMRKCD
jgi:hypothetical protein